MSEGTPDNQHRDQRQLRHMVQIDTKGEVFALQIAERTSGVAGSAPDRPRVLIFPKAGGCTVIPGMTISGLLTPTADEQGVARMAAVYDRLRKLELDVGGEGLPIDMLEAGASLLEAVRGTAADDAGAAGQVRTIRSLIEEWQGRTPDPARTTEQLVREVLAQADRWRIDASHYQDEAATAIDRAGKADSLAERIVGLEGELAATREDAAIWRHRAEEAAAETTAAAYRAEIRERIDAVPGVVRVHWPEGGMLRVMVAEGTSGEDEGAVYELVKAAIGADPPQFMVDGEPGAPPEGWLVWNGQRPGLDPEPVWLYGTGEEPDDVEDDAADGSSPTEAQAVDICWELAAEDRGDGNQPE